MIPIIALRSILFAALASVQALSVVSEGEQTVVLIEVEGEVGYEHQLLTSPPRIVVDVSGASLELPQRRYLDINRGGVLALRTSQFQDGVVRVVVDLAESVDYDVQSVGNVIRISFRNPSGPFQPWSSAGAAGAAATPTPARPDQPLGEPTAPGMAPADQPGRPVQVSRPEPPVVQEPPEPQQEPISITFRDTPILDVLTTFAAFAGRSIVPGEGVQNQTITAAIDNVPWDEALQAILETRGLTAIETASGILTVVSAENLQARQQAEPVIMESFDIQYTSADSIKVQIQELLGSGEGSVGRVSVNRNTNTLTVQARQSVVEQIRELIPRWDKRTPQVTIQARIIFVDRTALEGMGFRYEIKDSRGTMLNSVVPGFADADGDGIFEPGEETDEQVVNIGGSTLAAAGNAAARLPTSTLDILGTLVLGRHSLVTFIEALEELSFTDVQAEPVVYVLDHRNARVQVGERTPIRVADQGAGSVDVQATVRLEETGVILDVTPHVVGKDQVLLELHAERSNIAAAPADVGATFQTQETDTQILLNDGQTAVISGLTITQKTSSRTGIPILMNLPLVGALFRTVNEREQKQDLLIMVTPYIERDSGA